MKYVEYIAVAIAIGGGLLTKWNFPLAHVVLIIGLGALAFLYGLAGSIFFKIQEKRGSSIPFVVISSITLALGVLSLLFSEMNWSYSGLIAVISFIALPIILIINIYQLSQNKENPVPKMVVIRASILLLTLILF
jgi:hypothetical protein